MALKMKIGAGGIDGTARRGAWMCGELMNRFTASLAPMAGAATGGAPAVPMGRAGQPAGHGHASGSKSRLRPMVRFPSPTVAPGSARPTRRDQAINEPENV